MLENLDHVLEDVARRLVRAAKDRKSPMHTPVVVTGDVDARVMVLRDFDQAGWSLRFHTDTRAPKVRVIEQEPRLAALLYDRGAKIQLRLRGQGRIERDTELAQRAWESSDNFARRCYLGDGPGAVSDEPTSGLPAEFEGVEPDDEQLIPARANFGILLVELTDIDWFYLAHTGHSRAQFARGECGAWQGRWVSP